MKPHPDILDPIESRRCPECGTPGVRVRSFGPVEEWACPTCEPEAVPTDG